jgi:hypothetical protein
MHKTSVGRFIGSPHVGGSSESGLQRGSQAARVVFDQAQVGRRRPVGFGQSVGVQSSADAHTAFAGNALDQSRVADVFDEDRAHAVLLDLSDQARHGSG